MQIYKTDNETAMTFLKQHRANKEHISISAADLWLTADGVGVVGITYGKHKDRIKAFYVSPGYRGQGVGTELIQEALKYTGNHIVTTFATEMSAGIFRKAGFTETNRNKNGIAFMERRDYL